MSAPMSHDRENWLRVAKERDEIKAERDQLRVDRYYNRKCINRLASATGTLGEKSEKVVEVALSTIDQLRARAERAEASLHAMRLVCGTTDADKFTTWVDRANARAEKAEAELAAAKERLRSEAMDDYASIKDLQRELATEREKVRLLKFDKDRLDWYNGESYYQFGKSHKCMNSGWWWSCGYQQNNGKSGIQNIRDTIDSAMAHSKSGRNKYNVCKRIEDSIKEGEK